MNNKEGKQQSGASPPPPTLEEKQPINYNITVNIINVDGQLHMTDIEKATMIDKSKHETTETNIQAEKIEGSSIGKGNKTTNISLDGIKFIIILFSVLFLIFFVIAFYLYIKSGGQTNLFPVLEPVFKAFAPLLN